jgi:hypothetical protein
VIGHHDIQLAPSALLINFDGVKTEESIQTNSKRSMAVRSTESSAPDTHRAVEAYWLKNELPITGQPDQRLNALLDILLGYEASLHD